MSVYGDVDVDEDVDEEGCGEGGMVRVEWMGLEGRGWWRIVTLWGIWPSLRLRVGCGSDRSE